MIVRGRHAFRRPDFDRIEVVARDQDVRAQRGISVVGTRTPSRAFQSSRCAIVRRAAELDNLQVRTQDPDVAARHS